LNLELELELELTNDPSTLTLNDPMNPSDSNGLCLECGLCCNGVIFADGQLQAGDDVKHLQSLGLVLASNQKSQIKNQKFQQPCAAFDGCRCRIYADRPKYCREFECLLLQSVNDGRLETSAALRIIRTARQRAEKVKRLLREMGDTDEHVALSKRFRRTKKRAEAGALDEETADIFGQLTLAVHDLNVLLSEAFF
jgi:Fe-S-cluster containining protein